MSDADPENHVRDIPCPTDRLFQSPNADAATHEFHNDDHSEKEHAHRDAKKDPPSFGRKTFEWCADIFRNVCIRFISGDEFRSYDFVSHNIHYALFLIFDKYVTDGRVLRSAST